MMSSNIMPTLYEIVDEVCSRDFPILSKLTQSKQRVFVDLVYDDVMEGDSPEETSEQDIYNHVEFLIARAVTLLIDGGDKWDEFFKDDIEKTHKLIYNLVDKHDK